MKEKKALIEAALFMSADPLTLKQLSKISGITSQKKLEAILSQIKEDLAVDSRGFELALTGQGYHLRVKNQYLDIVSSLTPHSDLSDGMLRTLGIVALRQPIEQSFIVKVQGNKVYNYIHKLEERGLIKTEKAGRTRIIRTTLEFEKYFGKSLDEIKEALKDVAENEQSGDTISDQSNEEFDRLEDSED